MPDDELHILVNTLDGAQEKIPALAGWRVMEIMRDFCIKGIKAECGGACLCGTCHVYVDEPWASRLDPMREDEQARIEEEAIAPKSTSRLSCQIIMRDDLNGLVVTVAPNPD